MICSWGIVREALTALQYTSTAYVAKFNVHPRHLRPTLHALVCLSAYRLLVHLPDGSAGTIPIVAEGDGGGSGYHTSPAARHLRPCGPCGEGTKVTCGNDGRSGGGSGHVAEGSGALRRAAPRAMLCAGRWPAGCVAKEPWRRSVGRQAGTNRQRYRREQPTEWTPAGQCRESSESVQRRECRSGSAILPGRCVGSIARAAGPGRSP